MSSTPGFVYIATTADTKGQELEYVRHLITNLDLPVITLDLSTSGKPSLYHADVSAHEIAGYHPEGEQAVFCANRGQAIAAMAVAFERFMLSRRDIAALLGLGGSGGTAIITPAMQQLPIGLPKLMVSSMAAGDVAGYVGSSDIAMLYSVTDIAGLNRISRKVLSNAANQIAGAIRFHIDDDADSKPATGLTMFGVTTPCIKAVTSAIEHDWDCLVFHATGSGGQAMEKLIDSRLLNAVLDLTTTEVCDYLFDGVLACNEDRFGAIARTENPWCDVMRRAGYDQLRSPENHSGPLRQSSILLPQQPGNADAHHGAGEYPVGAMDWQQAERLCRGGMLCSTAGGFSSLDAPGQPFWDPQALGAFVHSLERTLVQTARRRLLKVPYHINDPLFAAVIIEQFNAIAATSK